MTSKFMLKNACNLEDLEKPILLTSSKLQPCLSKQLKLLDITKVADFL